MLREEGIAPENLEHIPEALEVVGRTLLAHTQSAVDDDFPSLRTLLWKLGARAVGTGVHEHDPVHVVTALAIDDPRTRDEIDVRAAIDDLGAFVRKGDVLYGVRELGGSLHDELAIAREVVAGGGLASAELIAATSPPPLARALAARPRAAGIEWLSASFPDADRAAALARDLGPIAASCDRFVIVRAAHIPSRDGFLAGDHHRAAAASRPRDQRRALEVRGYVWR